MISTRTSTCNRDRNKITCAINPLRVRVPVKLNTADLKTWTSVRKIGGRYKDPADSLAKTGKDDDGEGINGTNGGVDEEESVRYARFATRVDWDIDFSFKMEFLKENASGGNRLVMLLNLKYNLKRCNGECDRLKRTDRTGSTNHRDQIYDRRVTVG